MFNVEAVKSFAVGRNKKTLQQLNKTSPIPFKETCGKKESKGAVLGKEEGRISR